jgi:tRNA threonylcarbamoyl adenosine modification protein YeaZ
MRGTTVIKVVVEENKKVSKTLLPHIDSLLKEHGICLKDISFIAATTGPAPLTTLRSTLATINGIAAASGIPLIPLSTLDLLSLEPAISSEQAALAILDAFSGEIHFKIVADHELAQGTSTLQHLAQVLAQLPYKVFIIKGEQAAVYKKQLEVLVDTINFEAQNDLSDEFLAQEAFKEFQTNNVVNQLFPVYLKPAVYISHK